MKLLFSYLKQNKKILFLALGLAVINQTFSLLDPQIFRIVIDRYASHPENFSEQEFTQGVLFLLFGLVLVAFVSRLAKNFQDYYVNVVMQRVSARLYGDAVAHAFSLPYRIFEDEQSGALLQKLQKARADSQNLITSAVSVLFLPLVGIFIVVGYAFYVHWWVGMAYILMMPLLGVIIFFFSKRIKESQTQIVKEGAELAGATTETLRNVELVKSLGLESQESSRLNSLNSKILNLELTKAKTIRVLSFFQGTAIQFVRTGLLFLMLLLISRQEISLGEFFTLLFYSFMIFNPLYDLGQVSQNYQEARASLEQVNKVLETKPEPKPLDVTVIDGPLHSVSFNDVSFKYEGGNIPAVENISFNLKGGNTFAFVGPSGAGKSTLLKLLVGLYRPTGGDITVNNISNNNLDYEDFRSRVGYVSQETQLFAGTVRENLLFVNPSASDEDCWEVLRLASADSILEKGDKGLDTKIGEGGIKISGGERQRLAIARALLRNPQLIIFDEATSSLDSITEKAIVDTMKSIEKVRPNTITVLVAHRLSTIMHAGTIYVLEKGKIVEQGTHQDLLKSTGLYAALWREQSGGGI